MWPYFVASFVATSLLLPGGEVMSLAGVKTYLMILAIAFVLRGCYWLFIYPHFVSPLRHLPGPRDHHVLLGQLLHQFRSGNPNEPYVSWIKKWPDADMIRYFGVGNSEVLLATSIDACREILSGTHTYSFVKPSLFVKLIGPVPGKGLVFAEGEEHRTQRKLMAGPFSIAKLKQLIPVFQHMAQRLSAHFDKQVDSQGGIVEMVSTYSSITLDIIGVAALGVDLQNLETPTPFHESFQRIFDPSPLGQVLLLLNAFIPVRWIPLAENRHYKKAHADFHSVSREIIRERVRELTSAGELNAAKTTRRDLLTYMVQETYATKNPWTEEDLLGHVLTMMAAGHETTASALLWASYAMVCYPKTQTRLRGEILAMLARTPTPGYAEIESSRYLNNFCKEVLRLYCPAISSPREAVRDVVIRGLRIPKGTTVTVMPAAIQLHPRIWGDDAEEFNPDRWEGKPIDPHAFAAFLHGPRQCIGQVFSMLEFKIILIELLSKFSFEATPETEGKIALVNPSPLLRPKGGLKVKISRLSN